MKKHRKTSKKYRTKKYIKRLRQIAIQYIQTWGK